LPINLTMARRWRDFWNAGTCHRFVKAIRRQLHPAFLSNLTTLPGFFTPSVLTAWHKFAGV
jgi:hypothetical protein